MEGTRRQTNLSSQQVTERNRLYQQRRRQRLNASRVEQIREQHREQRRSQMYNIEQNEEEEEERQERRRLPQQHTRSSNQAPQNYGATVGHTRVEHLPRFVIDPSRYEHGSTSEIFEVPRVQVSNAADEPSTFAIHNRGPFDENVTLEPVLGRTWEAPTIPVTNTINDPMAENTNLEPIVVGPTRVYRQRVHHNCARDYRAIQTMHVFQLQPPTICPYCGAKLFQYESYDMCCLNGRTVLPHTPIPADMLAIFTDQTSEGRHFRQNIRSYNHVFSFTSMGVHVDENVASRSRGVYTFRAQGSIYHKIGSFLPTMSNRPRYLQLYIYDTDHEIDNRLAESRDLRRDVIEKIKGILDSNNPFVQRFRQLAQRSDIQNCKLIIREHAANRPQYSLPTASQVAAIVVGGEEAASINGRDIMVESLSGGLIYVQDIAGFYDPLQYPLLLPYGTYGWDTDTMSENGRKLTCRDYYAYMLQIRPDKESLLLRGGRLLQQYVVDNYVKIESNKLRWIRTHQDNIRAELYQGLQDCISAGQDNADNVGRRTILPSSFVGSPRDMYQRYQDAMSLVQKYGKPDLFLTMTCNPNWEEVKAELLPGQTSNDRPDLLTRVFHAKFEELKKDLLTRHVLGKVLAYVYVIEFQKRGLPHVHMLLILDEDDKLYSPDDYDRIVRAEIPNKEEEPELYNVVLRHMIHGPCGMHNMRSPCMKEGKCKKNFPKRFSSSTTTGNDSYPVYRRREGNAVPLHEDSDNMVDNSWVVPYNPWLLMKYNCHINVEICSSVQSVKYLYKYVYKGPDRVSLQLQRSSNQDEIQQFVDGRWICAPEAFWKIFKFTMSRMYPSVERLQIHLQNRQQVRFNRHLPISEVLTDDRNSRTMLTAFFEKNATDISANQYLYREFPEHYKWNNSRKIWERRRSRQKVIGRIYTVSPSEGERFYLRVLLNHVRGPRSFEHLLTFEGEICRTFKQAAEKRGLLQHDESVRQCLLEASITHMPSALRRLFVTVLVYCEPTAVRDLWEEFYPYMMEDYVSSATTDNNLLRNKLLHELSNLLLQHNKRLSDYDLPVMTESFVGALSKIIEDELAIVTPQNDLNSISKLNHFQSLAYTEIIGAIERGESKVFFLDGPGGTGKTYLYRALLASLRSRGCIALATATSGIAATLIPGGRTAHSRFKIPLNPDPTSICSISKQSDLAELIRRAVVIIWDEAPMTNRYAFEALDRTFKDIIGVDLPFGGKVMVFGGDFRQALPVIPQGTKAETIAACIVKSVLWRDVQVVRLKQNMRSVDDNHFSQFLLQVGDGIQPTVDDNMITIPPNMVIPWEGEDSINNLIEEVYPNINNHVADSSYMVGRGLITPRNEDVDKLNQKIIENFSGRQKIYYSFDIVENDEQNLYQQEFLNSIAPGGLPPHQLTLKVGAPIMLLRNIDPSIGLCNGTRLICRDLKANFIDAEIMTGQYQGTRVFIPRIPLKTPENMRLPFEMTRTQFPVRLSFALTINKSQGQTIPHVGIYLPDHVFSHGQLYVALSRGVSERSTKVLVKKGLIVNNPGVYTKNIVYKEVLLQNVTF